MQVVTPIKLQYKAQRVIRLVFSLCSTYDCVQIPLVICLMRTVLSMWKLPGMTGGWIKAFSSQNTWWVSRNIHFWFLWKKIPQLCSKLNKICCTTTACVSDFITRPVKHYLSKTFFDRLSPSTTGTLMNNLNFIYGSFFLLCYVIKILLASHLCADKRIKMSAVWNMKKNLSSWFRHPMWQELFTLAMPWPMLCKIV